MMKPRLLFISPVFLFPNDAGGKIRTTNILRGLRASGVFEVTLMSPADAGQQQRWGEELMEVADRFVGWTPPPRRPRWNRALDLLQPLPVNVVADNTRAARAAVHEALRTTDFDLAVFDFVHSAVLVPSKMSTRRVCFTHNVEAEIFARHAQQASNPLMRWIWRSQHVKMERFEREMLSAFDAVIAVSERDEKTFRTQYGLSRTAFIPTGVDLDHFAWALPPEVDESRPPTAVFTGSMDWAANVDGVSDFLDNVWPQVLAKSPAARFVIVGRNPPAVLLARAKQMPGVSCTGFVDDVRPYVRSAHVFVIPLRVGGGTRIKAFEAMAMGCPVVATTIGMEGLDVVDGEHYLCRDGHEAQAQAVLDLFGSPTLRERLSRDARRLVEASFGHRKVASVFERICKEAMERVPA